MSEKWIEIKSDFSNLPKDRQQVLFVVMTGGVCRERKKGIFLEKYINQHVSTENIFFGDDQSFNILVSVSHWMELPELPALPHPPYLRTKPKDKNG